MPKEIKGLTSLFMIGDVTRPVRAVGFQDAHAPLLGLLIAFVSVPSGLHNALTSCHSEASTAIH